MEELLCAKGIVKNFGQTKALKGVDLVLSKGEIRGLIGENGSGKSTICSIITGMYTADEGELTLRGEPFKPASMIDAQKHGVAMIVQEMGTISGIRVADNIFVGKESRFGKGPFINPSKMYKEAGEILHKLGIDHIDPKSLIDEHNFENRKLIEIARAMYDDPDILIVDETTTALSQQGRDIVYKICKDFAASGKGVIFISHDLDEIMDICTATTVFRDGEYIGTLTKEEFEPSVIRQMMVGRELVGDYYRSDYDGSCGEQVVLSMQDVFDGRMLENFNLELHEGEILGIGGLTDCGMHDVGRLAFGIDRPLHGHVRLADGTEVTEPAVATKHRLGYISKNRDIESLMITASVKDNVALPALDDLKKGGLIFRSSELKQAKEQKEALAIKCADLDQVVRYLSGGNKQKVVFGRWIGNKSRILVLDCPTRGVDVGAKQAMYQLIYKLKKEGCSIIMISEELQELIGMSDRIMIMKDGKISGEFNRSPEVTEHVLIDYMV